MNKIFLLLAFVSVLGVTGILFYNDSFEPEIPELVGEWHTIDYSSEVRLELRIHSQDAFGNFSGAIRIDGTNSYYIDGKIDRFGTIFLSESVEDLFTFRGRLEPSGLIVGRLNNDRLAIMARFYDKDSTVTIDMKTINWYKVNVDEKRDLLIGEGIYDNIVFVRNFKKTKDGDPILLKGWEGKKPRGLIYFVSDTVKIDQEIVKAAVDEFLKNENS